jgi:hypothetical protein
VPDDEIRCSIEKFADELEMRADLKDETAKNLDAS